MPKNTADFAGVVVSGATYCHFPSHHGSTLLSFFVGSVSPLCIQIHRGRRPGVAPGPLRYRHSFRFTPLLAGLLVGTCGGIPGRTTSKVFKSRARLRPYIYPKELFAREWRRVEIQSLWLCVPKISRPVL